MSSQIQTAIECGLNPYRYLTWLMKIANNADDLEVVQRLLFWNTAAANTAYAEQGEFGTIKLKKHGAILGIS